MATQKTELQNLGRFEGIEEGDLKIGSVLLGRFGVIGEPRTTRHGLALPVEDLDHELGDAPHRLELLLPSEPGSQQRISSAQVVQNRLQSSICAVARAGGKTVLLLQAPIGVPVPTPLLQLSAPAEAESEPPTRGDTSQQVLSLAVELTKLLAELHQAGVHGVEVTPSLLRFEDGLYALDGFDHILVEARSPGQDVAALVDLLGRLGVPNEEIRSISTAQRLHEQLVTSEAKAVQSVTIGDMPFVGREEALATLNAQISQALIARPTAVVVSGERGVGKSRLLREFAQVHLDSEDLLVLSGSWQSQTGESRSGLLGAIEQLSEVLPRLDPDERDDIRRRINRATGNLGAILLRSAPVLGSVLMHAEELPQLALGGDFSRHTAVIADVLKCLGTRQRPLLLVLDNLEAIDANSAVVLDIITQSVPAHYTLVVAGLRAEAGTAPPFVHQTLELRPLNKADVGDFLARALPEGIEDPEALQELLWSASSGLPLTLGATLRTWRDRGRIVRGPDGRWRASQSLFQTKHDAPSARALYAARFSALPDQVRLTALRFAVFGIELHRNYFEDIDDPTVSAIGALLACGILVKSATGARFPHDTVRELVFEFFSEAERRSAHRHAAAVLSKRRAAIPQIVYHRDFGLDEESATPEDLDKLSRLHVEAGRDRLDVYDLERARWHLERALEHSRDPVQRSIAAEGLGDVCLLQDDVETGVALYTAIIATATPSTAVRVAAKAVQFLFSKSVNRDAKQLALMALEVAHEPTPTTTPGKLWVLAASLVRSWLGKCELDAPLRDGLCLIYLHLIFIGLIDDPVSVLACVGRAHWIASGLRSGPAATVLSVEAALMAVLGQTAYAEKTFGLVTEIAHETKHVWAQGMVYHHWGLALVGMDRYSEGQDRFDDAVAAYREAGDVSNLLLIMFFKALYGRDREPADRILGWIDEALTMARRNGKRSGVQTLEALKLHVLARQGHSDIGERIVSYAETMRRDDAPGIERMGAYIQLAYAALEGDEVEAGRGYVAIAKKYAEEMGSSVPEFCQEVHMIAALYQLRQPLTSRAERKALKRSVKKLHTAAKRAPRLRVLADLLDLKVAIQTGDSAKAKARAVKIVIEFEQHENLHAARQAHLALASLFKGENVLAAAEHDRVARNLGRRLGLMDHVLLSDFSELGREVGILALADLTTSNFGESQDEVPAAGMLSPAGGEARNESAGAANLGTDDVGDILAVWALDTDVVPRVSLGSILSPVRDAVAIADDSSRLELVCSNPDLAVPIASSDLQILIINMVQTCRDAIGVEVKMVISIKDTIIANSDDLAHLRLHKSGHYLVIQVSAFGAGAQTPVIGAFSHCENIVRTLGGTLNASTEQGMVGLTAHVELADASFDTEDWA